MHMPEEYSGMRMRKDRGCEEGEQETHSSFRRGRRRESSGQECQVEDLREAVVMPCWGTERT